jgi:hypothetical protein
MHMINSAVSNTLMPRPVSATATTPPTIRYAFTVHQLVVCKLATNYFRGAIIDRDTGPILEYRHLVKIPATKSVQETSFANKIGRLFQGIQNLKGTDTCFFIAKLFGPTNKRPTYGRIICNFCPQKKEQNCTCLTVGGNQIDYPRNKSTPTTDLTTAKLLINPTISTPGAIFLGIDLANFYLNTPLPNYEYMQLCLDIIPEEIILAYNLRDIVDPDGWVYIEIRKGMYGLPQAGILANKLLEKCLSTRGYYQCQHMPGLWRHIGGPSLFASSLTTLA